MHICTCGHDRASHDQGRYCWATTAGARGASTCTCSRYTPRKS